MTDSSRSSAANGDGDAKPLRVLILNQPFAPDVVATAQIAKDLADALVARGHHVTAIASRSIYGQTGATLPKREILDGVEVRRVGSNLFGKSTIIGRLANFAWYYVRATALGLFGRRYDVVIALTTPPYIAMAGLIMKRLRGSRLVYWLMDIYPDVMVAHGMLRERSLLHRVLRRLHLHILNRADATIALGRCMRDRLVAQGAAADSIEIVRPWSPAPEIDRTPRESNPYRSEWRIGDRLLVMYSGNFGLAHDVRTFLEAAERLKDNDRIRFAFVGGGNRQPEVEAFVRDRTLNNCLIAPYQPLEKLPSLLAAADVHLVTMAEGMEGLVVPSKFFGVAGAARPTLFIGPESSEIARCVVDWECGQVFRVGDSVNLASAIERWAAQPEALQAMGRRALDGFRRYAERAACTQHIIALLEQRVVAGSRSAATSEAA